MPAENSRSIRQSDRLLVPASGLRRAFTKGLVFPNQIVDQISTSPGRG